MLIETPYKTGDTVSLKLTGGEEVVGRFDSENADGVTLSKPMMLIMQGQGLGLGPFMFSASHDSKFTLKSSAITCIVKTEKDLAKQYVSSTTGIALPQKGQNMNIVIWSRDHCGYCESAKKLLQSKEIPFTENKIGKTHTREQLLEAVPEAKTVPQIFIDDKLIGGYAELNKFFKDQA